MFNPGSSAKWRRMALVAAIGLGAGLVAAGTASATMFQKVEPYAGVDNFPIDGYCGLAEVQLNVEFSGKVHIREGKGKQASAFFFHDNYSALETITNRQNGKFFTISHDGVNKDIRATRVEGSIFEFVSQDVGQPFVVRDMDGNVVLRDRGAIAFTYLFDTLGDDVPGGDFIEDLDVRVSGPHPAFFSEPGDECATVVEMIG
jgi:hypothetical protein